MKNNFYGQFFFENFSAKFFAGFLMKNFSPRFYPNLIAAFVFFLRLPLNVSGVAHESITYQKQMGGFWLVSLIVRGRRTEKQSSSRIPQTDRYSHIHQTDPNTILLGIQRSSGRQVEQHHDDHISWRCSLSLLDGIQCIHGRDTSSSEITTTWS